MKLLVATLVCASLPLAHAASRSSATYSLPAEIQDFAGERATSASYRMDVTAGGAGATATSAADVLHSGFAGQLTEYASLTLTTELSSLAETTARQLSASLTLDDGTLVILPATRVRWSVEDGPGLRITDEGLFLARSVFADTPATAGASFGGLRETLDLTVINVTNDDFGAYAGDGIDDDWQVRHFGQDNPLARGEEDPDNDGFSNAFEFVAGLDPTSVASAFRQSIALESLEPFLMRIVFGPLSANVTYSIESTPALAAEADWRPIADFTVNDENGQRTVVDTSPLASMRFYRIQLIRTGPTTD